MRNYEKDDDIQINAKLEENFEKFDPLSPKEEDAKNTKILNPIKLTLHKRSIKNLPKIKGTNRTNDLFIETTVKLDPKTEKEEKEEKEIQIQEKEVKKEELIIIKSPKFWEYYWEFLSLKQPIINLFAPLKCLKIVDSNIPTLVKLMRIVFLLSLNIFFNIFHLDQKYFRKKYEYFNGKYNIRYVFLNKKISLSERFSYAFKNTIISSLISFLVTFIIQSILNYFFFNNKKVSIKYNTRLIKFSTDKKLNVNEEKENINDNSKYLPEKERKKYIIFFGVGFIIMIIIFYSAITFNGVYTGGLSDLIAATIWTFIFLQIIPFILCLGFALLK